MKKQFRFDLQRFAGEGGDQPTDVFDINGEQVPFSELDPKLVRGWYESHTNMDGFQRSNTQKAQEIADQRREFEAQRKSYENQVKDYETMVQYLNSHPDLQAYIESYVQRSSAQTPQQHGQPPGLSHAMEQRLAQLEQRLQKGEATIEEGERNRQRAEALEHLTKTYPKYDNQKFNEFFMNGMGDVNTVKDLYDLVYCAMIGRQLIADQAKAGSQMQLGETATGRMEPNIVVERKPGGPSTMDQIFEGIAKEKGITDY